MGQEPDGPIKLTPAIDKIAVDLARIFRLIRLRSPSRAVTEAWFVAFARKVLREMEILGESPEGALDIFLAGMRILLDETEKKLNLDTQSESNPSPSD